MFGITFVSFILFGLDFEKIVELFVVRDMAAFLRQKEKYRNCFGKVMTSDVESISINEGIKMMQMIKAYSITQNELDDTSNLVMIILGSVLGLIGQVFLGIAVIGCMYQGCVDKSFTSIWSFIGELLDEWLFWVGGSMFIAKYVLFGIEDKKDDAEVNKISIKMDEKAKEEKESKEKEE